MKRTYYFCIIFLMAFSHLSMSAQNTNVNHMEKFWYFNGKRTFVYGRFHFKLDQSFSIKERKLIKLAVEALDYVVEEDEVYDCAKTHSYRNFPLSISSLRKKWSMLLEGQGYYKLKIMKKNNDDKAMASSYVGRGFLPKDFIIGVNTNYLTDDFNLSVWAGILAHEILHNFGLDHLDGYKGSYIDEFGHCVEKQVVQILDEVKFPRQNNNTFNCHYALTADGDFS